MRAPASARAPPILWANAPTPSTIIEGLALCSLWSVLINLSATKYTNHRKSQLVSALCLRFCTQKQAMDKHYKRAKV
jgi:hypothetical protein